MQFTLGLNKKTLLKPALLILMGSLAMGLCTHLRIHLFFTPVPLVVQNAVAIALGIALGPVMGAISVGVFLLTRFDALMSPLGGYLIGYLLSAVTAGSIYKMHARLLPVALFVALLVQYACGLGVLSFYLPAARLLPLGVYPFFLLDVCKLAGVWLLNKAAIRRT